MLLSNLCVIQAQRNSETLYVFLYANLLVAWSRPLSGSWGCRQIWDLEIDIRLKGLLAWLVSTFLVSDLFEEVK